MKGKSKFFATESDHDIGGACALIDQDSCLFKDQITNILSVLVIDLFEVVKVTHEQAKGFIATFQMLTVGGLFIQHLQLVLEELGVAHINFVEQDLQFKCEFRGTLGI